eukprot:3529216-Alexandrium_andersonii.AAC.1
MAAMQAMCGALFEELEQQPSLPAIIGGDFNALVSSIAPVADVLRRGLWHDVGAMSTLTGDSQPLATCCAHNAAAPVRRDFLLVPTALLAQVAYVRLRHGAGYDVHTPIQLAMRVNMHASFTHLVTSEPYLAPEGWKQHQWRREVQACVQHEFMQVAEPLEACLKAGDTTKFWTLWSRAFEGGLRQASQGAGVHRGGPFAKGKPASRIYTPAKEWSIVP